MLIINKMGMGVGQFFINAYNFKFTDVISTLYGKIFEMTKCILVHPHKLLGATTPYHSLAPNYHLLHKQWLWYAHLITKHYSTLHGTIFETTKCILVHPHKFLGVTTPYHSLAPSDHFLLQMQRLWYAYLITTHSLISATSGGLKLNRYRVLTIYISSTNLTTAAYTDYFVCKLLSLCWKPRPVTFKVPATHPFTQWKK